MNPKDTNRIDRLERSLNSRAHPSQYSDSRAEMNRPAIAVNPLWRGNEHVEDLVLKTREYKEHAQNRIFKKILWGSIIFFILALMVGGFIFFRGINMVSSNNIDILVSGPSSVAGGQELPLEITLQNKNSASLEGASLLVEYPVGARVAGDPNTVLTRQSIPIGTIPARGSVVQTVKSVLFGEKGSIENIKVTLDYRISGTSAVFKKEKNYDIGIASSPIIVTPQYPSEVDSNQDFTLVLKVSSNTNELLHNVLVQADYPFGFTFASSDPKPSTDSNVWNLGDLDVGDSRTITIHGKLQGQDKEERTFQFSSGVANTTDVNKIATVLTSLQNSITIKKSPIDLAITVSGVSGNPYIASPKQRIPVSVSWTNNLSSQVVDAQIQVKLSGTALDRNSVVTSGGYYRSIDNTIVWDKTNDTRFASILPGQKGSVTFSVSALPVTSSIKNQGISMDATFNGNQITKGEAPQTITSSLAQDVRIASQLGFNARIVRSVGPFENSGSVPPKAENPTTYTIIWTATSPLNDIKNAKVSATLPIYVSWPGVVSGSNESITYDSVTRTVSWNIGTIKAGTGYGTSPREADFQITFLPSLGQLGTAPTLVNEPSVSGTDAFTGEDLSSTKLPLTTLTSTDPAYKQGDDIVIQ